VGVRVEISLTSPTPPTRKEAQMATPKPIDGMSQDVFVAWLKGEIQAIGTEYRKALAEGNRCAVALAKEVAEIAPSDPDQGNLFDSKDRKQ
jgi:hypothetical protein